MHRKTVHPALAIPTIGTHEQAVAARENHAARRRDAKTAGPSSPTPLYCTKIQLVRFDDDQSAGKRVLLPG
jgi:hypothetical protein